jgi:hypothetical protein
MFNDEYYKHKYLKYKNKYKLKNQMKGGSNIFDKGDSNIFDKGGSDTSDKGGSGTFDSDIFRSVPSNNSNVDPIRSARYIPVNSDLKSDIYDKKIDISDNIQTFIDIIPGTIFEDIILKKTKFNFKLKNIINDIEYNINIDINPDIFDSINTNFNILFSEELINTIKQKIEDSKKQVTIIKEKKKYTDAEIKNIESQKTQITEKTEEPEQPEEKKEDYKILLGKLNEQLANLNDVLSELDEEKKFQEHNITKNTKYLEQKTTLSSTIIKYIKSKYEDINITLSLFVNIIFSLFCLLNSNIKISINEFLFLVIIFNNTTIEIILMENYDFTDDNNIHYIEDSNDILNYYAYYEKLSIEAQTNITTILNEYNIKIE